ncbi:glycosyltransferase [Streptomyces sp. NPDC013161]|uniref:glycosyltransferase n=1 Tax=Streptomyces sp. NPDC013161 TaxID=3364862 RepID=UPI0036B1A349
MKAASGPPWVVISDYPAWPSPYFAELERHAPAELGLVFSARLDPLILSPGLPGVVNLHRIKRLYQGPDGRRSHEAAVAMLAQLAVLRAAGWKIVWTVHNLLPIDGTAPRAVDQYAADGVLGLADAVVTHTQADADHVRTLTSAPVTVAGWAAPTPAPGPVPAPLTDLARQMAQVPLAVLILGNVTAYKDLPAVTDALLRSTRTAHLFLVGPCREPDLAEELAARAAANPRVHLHLDRVPARAAHVLYRAAGAALCPYRTAGPWEFFTRMLYPGSVATALACGTPVIAPDLPAIREMTAGRPARLYPPQTGPGPALADAETAPALPTAPPEPAPGARWAAIGSTYAHLARTLNGP